MSNSSSTPQRHAGTRKIIIACVIVAVIVIAGVIYYGFYYAGKPPWFFKGAYAEYRGVATGIAGIFPVAVSINLRLEVVDTSNNVATVLMSGVISAGVFSKDFSSTFTIDLTGKVENTTLEYVGEEYKYIPGFGTRKCLVYESTNENLRTRMYVDKEAKWPIAFEFTISTKGAFINIPLELTDTNIPSLKK